MNVPAKAETPPAPSTIEDVLMRGDLSKLTPQQRIQYNMDVCNSLGLNWRTRPFEFITLGGKLVFYARRDAADQLRKINGISVEIINQETTAEGLRVVTVRATDKSGRADTDVGVVNMKNLAGEFAANAMMKAITKAKRRVTLSISGLGFLDETEVESIATDDDLIAEHDPPTENKPYKISFQSWRMFGELLLKEVKEAESKSDIFEWLDLNKETLAEMEKKVPVMFANLTKAINEIKAEPT